MAHRDEPLPLARAATGQRPAARTIATCCRTCRPTKHARIGGEQEIIARYEPEKAIETLPTLLAQRKDRDRLLTLLERVLADKRVQHIQPTPAQVAMLARIRQVLGRPERLLPAPDRAGSRGRRKVLTAAG